MKPTSTGGSAEHGRLSRAFSSSVRTFSLCDSTSAAAASHTGIFICWPFRLKTLSIFFFQWCTIASKSRHMQCILHLYSVYNLTDPPRGESKLLLTPLLTCDMHIYENLTSFRVKETGNKQSSSPSHSRRDALCEDLGRGDNRCFQQVQGWGGVSKVSRWSSLQPLIDFKDMWALKALKQTQGQPDSTALLHLCSCVRWQSGEVGGQGGRGHCIIYRTCTVHYGSSLSQLGYIPLFPARTYNNKNTGRCTDHDVLLRRYSWRGV